MTATKSNHSRALPGIDTYGRFGSGRIGMVGAAERTGYNGAMVRLDYPNGDRSYQPLAAFVPVDEAEGLAAIKAALDAVNARRAAFSVIEGSPSLNGGRA